MGFSPLANMRRRVGPAGRQSPRNGPVRGFTIHHQAGVDAHGQATAAGREVSANYWITNDGTIIPNIDENMRAWTTGAAGYPGGAASDHRNITVEVSNSPEGVRTGSWAISAAARRALVNLIGDVFKRHGFGTVRRGTNGGVAVHQDFVPTACPGPYIMRNLNSIITDAEKARRGGTSPKPKPIAWEDTMKAFSGKSSRSKNQTVRGGQPWYVTFLDDHSDSKWGDRTIARGPGHVVGLNVNTRFEGEPGTRVNLELVKETGADKNRVKIGEARVTLDTYGAGSEQVGFSGYLKSGELVRLLAHVQDGKTVEVAQFYWSGMARSG